MEEAASNPELMDDASSAPQDVNTPAASSSGQHNELADDDIAKSTSATEIECVSFDFEDNDCAESTSDSAQSASGIKSSLSELKGDQVFFMDAINKDAASTGYLAQSTNGFQTPPEEASIHSDIFNLPPLEPFSELCPLNIPPFEPVSELCQLCGTKLCHEHQDHTILPCGHRVHIVCLCVIHGADSSHLSFCPACPANSGAQ